MPDAAVTFEHVTKSYITSRDEVVVALQDVSFEVGDGEFVAIVGPSGCGKSTALNVLAGITPATRGRALIRGKPPTDSRFDIGYVFQQDTVLPWKRVLDNIETGLVIRKVAPAERRRRAQELVDLMGLSG